MFTKEVLGMLGLSVSKSKTCVTDFWQGFEFLGFRFCARRLGIRPKAIEGFKDKVRKRTRRQQGEKRGRNPR